MQNKNKTVQAYLHFDGTCSQAMKFYSGIFGGDLQMFPYSESPYAEMKNVSDRMMHASLSREGVSILMAADSMPGEARKVGDNVKMYFGCDTVAEAEKIFVALSEKGKVEMPLEKTFWATRFGMLADQFGIHWMIGVHSPE